MLEAEHYHTHFSVSRMPSIIDDYLAQLQYVIVAFRHRVGDACMEVMMMTLYIFVVSRA
jgi:hypothetical protein